MKNPISEKELKKFSYEELNEELYTYDDKLLLQLVNSSSVKVGDTAASLLARRKKSDEIYKAALENFFKNEKSRLRAMWILEQCKDPHAREVNLFYLTSKTTHGV